MTNGTMTEQERKQLVAKILIENADLICHMTKTKQIDFIASDGSVWRYEHNFPKKIRPTN